MKIDLQKIRSMVRDSADFPAYIDSYLKQCISAGDPPLLSDAIAGFDKGGVHILEALAEKYHLDRDMPENMRFRWKIFCKRDEWGNAPSPGDIVYRKVQKPLMHAPGKPALSSELSLDIINGTYNEKWCRFIPYEVDEKGCITCEFQDAVHFIRCWGIHPNSGLGGPPLSMHLREQSQEPVMAPDGNKLHVWYHRYVEIDKAGYEALPKIDKRKGMKRGCKKEVNNG